MDLRWATSGEVAALAPPVLAVPVGSCEQHGPHLPLATDTIIAETLAARLASAVAGVVVGPALTVTASGEHQGFPGTLSIGTDVTAAALVELARSASWAGAIVLVNGHGGNLEAVDRAVTTARREGRRLTSWWPHAPAGDAHAGHTETSLMLAIRPDLVRLDRLEPGVVAPLDELLPALRAGGMQAVSTNGVLGDPRAATLDAGNRLLELLINDLVAFTRRVVSDPWNHA